MISKFLVFLILIPVKTLLFLVSPTHFKKVINHKGKILITNDNVLDTNNFTKGNNRRVVVTKDNGGNIEVNKITKDKNHIKTATKVEQEMQNNSSVKINYKNYPKSLNKESVVDNRVYTINQKTKKPITINDIEFTDTGDRLTRNDLRKVNKMRH